MKPRIKSKYIKITTCQELPNGQETDQKFMNIVPLNQDIQIQNCMITLKI